MGSSTTYSVLIAAIEETIARRQQAKRDFEYYSAELAMLGVHLKEIGTEVAWSPNPGDLETLTSVEHLAEVETSQSGVFRCYPGWPAALLPELVRGLPQVGLPPANAHG